MIRKGHHNGSSYWYCKTCNRYSSGRKKPSQEAIFNRYSQGTFTIKELSQEFNISASTVKRILRNYTVTKVVHTPGKVVIQMDTTYWGRNFGRYCPINVCKLQSSYICGDFKNQIKNNEAYNGTKIGNYFRNGLK